MTQSKFHALCLSLGIAPTIALENDNVRAALVARDDALVERLLREEF